jgi:hypothetical protein
MSRRSLLSILPLLLVTLSCIGKVFAGETAPVVSLSAPPPTLDYLLTMGPYGALALGAYLLGGAAEKGLPLRIQLDPDTLEVLKDLVEKITPPKR